jgi:hypothetical protein
MVTVNVSSNPVDCHYNYSEQGGRYQVSCLRIDKGDDNIEWLYESRNITRYLNQRFASERQ